MVRDALKVAVIVLGWTVVADIVGVIACFVLDVVPLRYGSGALPFVVWGVLGVFCGGVAAGSAGGALLKDHEMGWFDRPEAPRTAQFVLAVTVVLFAALCLIFNHLWWRFHPSGDFFVPDTASLTLTYFGGILACMTGFAFTCGPIKRTKRKAKMK